MSLVCVLSYSFLFFRVTCAYLCITRNSWNHFQLGGAIVKNMRIYIFYVTCIMIWGYLTYSRSISCAAKQANFAVTSAATGPTTIAWAQTVPSASIWAWVWDRRRRHGELCEYFLRWLHAFLAITNSIGAVGQIQSKNVNTWYNFYMVFSCNTLYICLLWVYNSWEQLKQTEEEHKGSLK